MYGSKTGIKCSQQGSPQDLDLYLWLPNAPNAQDAGQPAQFIVGYGGDAFGYVEGDPYGTMNAFPYARLKREGGYLDGYPTIEFDQLCQPPVSWLFNCKYCPAVLGGFV